MYSPYDHTGWEHLPRSRDRARARAAPQPSIGDVLLLGLTIGLPITALVMIVAISA